MVIVSDILLPKDANGILKVSDVHNSEEGDLSCRVDIADPSTSTFIKTDAVGRLNILESNIEGAGADNSLNATSYPVHQVGAFDGSAYRSSKCDNKGRLETLVFGNTSSDGSGDTNCLHVTTNGNLLVQNAASVNTLPANTANSGLTDDPANSFAVGLRARTNINQASTETFIACDATGALIVRADNSNDSIRIVGQNSAGANKGVGVEDTDGGILSAGKVVVADPSSADGSRQLLRLNAKHELLVSSSLGGKTELDVFTLAERTVTGPSITSTNTLELKGTGKVCITIHADTNSHSAIVKLSNDGTNFFSPTSGATFNPSGTGFLLVAEFDNIAKFVEVTYSNTSGGTVVISAAKLVYA